MTHAVHEPLAEASFEIAASWHDRLQREKATEETRREFEAWLAASSSHRDAYAKVERIWSVLKERAESPSILALRHETALRLTRRATRQVSAVRTVAAVLALVAIGAGGFAWLAPAALAQAVGEWVRYLLPGESHYGTATGERLNATLRDGSQVTLDTASELDVVFTKAERLVHLKRGQAFFEVAKDEARPFVVQVRDRRLVAVGTAFDVRLDSRQIRVTMVEGTVRVERAAGSGERASALEASGTARDVGAPVTTITAGQQLVTDAGTGDQVQTTDPERSTSWRKGQLIFDDTRLGDAVAELNRYSRVKIELADPALTELRLSGAFATGRPTVFVEAVTTYFPIQVSRADERAVVLDAKK